MLYKRNKSEVCNEAVSELPTYPPSKKISELLVPGCLVGRHIWYRVSRRLKRSGSNRPIVFSTAHDKPIFRQEAFQAGCSAYLHKGDSRETVLSAIRDVIQSNQEKKTG